MSEMITVREYAELVDAEPRTVRCWMKNGLLKFTKPRGHRARLINSAQPRPKKKRKKKPTNTAERIIKPVASVPRQVGKRPPIIPRQFNKNPGFEKLLKSSEPELSKLASHKSVLSKSVSDESDDPDVWFSFGIGDLLVIGLMFLASVKLLPKIFPKMR